MTTVKGKRFVREVVILDDHEFIDCVFVECRLSFKGGEVSMADCAFIRPDLEFSGSAANTVSLLSAMNGLNPKMFTVKG